MYSIRVVPIKKVAKLEELTYFSANPIEPGSVVVVEIGRREIDALVLECKDLKTDKQEFKRASFKLKKILRVKGHSFLNEKFLEVVEMTRRYFATSSPSVFGTLIPSIFVQKIKLDKKSEPTTVNTDKKSIEKFILQAPRSERQSYYKTLIRESFARKESVFIMVPTWFDAQKLYDFLSRGIEEHSVLLYSGEKDSVLIKSFKKITDEPHPLCIIGTGSFLCIPRKDIGTLIVENESSDAYKTISTPHIDMRTVAYFYAHTHRIRLLLCDTILRSETLYKLETHEFLEIRPLNFRIEKPKSVTLVDRSIKTDKKQGFIFSEEVENLLIKTDKEKTNVFMFALRKGFAPTTVCNDCGERVRCPKCKTPLFLLGSDKKNDDPMRKFICQKCKYKERTNITCSSCGSWNLVALGIGTDRVFEALTERFPSRKIFQIDKERVKSHKEAVALIEEFENSPGSILVGTELAMYYFTKKVPVSVIVSFDTLFSIPSYTISEKVIRLLDDVSVNTTNELIIQSRSEEDVLEAYMHGTLHSFFRNELSDRKNFFYPPYSTIFKITAKGKKERIGEVTNILKEVFSGVQFDIWESVIAGGKNEYKVSLLMKIPENSWSIERLAQKKDLDPIIESKLASLPLDVQIEINPGSIL